MKKGCLLFFLLFVGSSVADYFLLEKYRPDISPWVGILLGLAVTATVANLYGIYTGFKQKRLLAKSPSDWKDGELIGVSGRISTTRDALTAPGSGRRVAIYEYDVKRTVVTGSGKNRSTSTVNDYSGFGMAPCAIQSKRGALKLVGYPMLAHFPKKNLVDRNDMERLIQYLSTAKLTPRAKGIGGALKQINEVLKDEDGDVLLDLRDEGAYSTPAPVGEAPQSATAGSEESDEEVQFLNGEGFRSEFYNAGYTIEETVVENSAQVTAFGTYRTNPARLDVGGIFDTFSHALFPGEGESVTSKNLMKSTIAFVIFAAIAFAAHYYTVGEGLGWR